jgi:hypothetical protein
MALIIRDSPLYPDMMKILGTAKFAEAMGRRFPPLFRTSSVYDWKEPTIHPPGCFIVRPDPYEWFDPINGMDRRPEVRAADHMTITRHFEWRSNAKSPAQPEG